MPKLLSMLLMYLVSNPDMIIKVLTLLQARLEQKSTGALPPDGVSAEGIPDDLVAEVDAIVAAA